LAPDEIDALRLRHYNATLLERRDIHADLAVFRIRPDGGIPTFAAGQYLAVGLGYWEPRVAGAQPETLPVAKQQKLVRRAYSISCPLVGPDGGPRPCSTWDFLEFYVTLVREAAEPPALTPRLFGLQPGARLSVERHVVGRYVLEGIEPDEDVLMLGTGTGEAPHNAMAAELLARGHRGRIAVATGVRSRSDLAYLAEHRRLMERFPHYRYLSYTTRDPENLDPRHPHYVGKQYLQKLWASGQLQRDAGMSCDPARTHLFLCGNPAMIGYQPPGAAALAEPGMLQLLEADGYNREHTGRPGTIRFEKYW
jgi:ferredoxin--NADP+ reductase